MATGTVAVTTMKSAEILAPGADFQIVEREIPNPGPREVRIKVQACGICHSDVLTKDGLLPGIQYPRVPGHEVAGLVDQLGADAPSGRWDSGLGWAGTAAMTVSVANAVAAIFAIAATSRSRASATTAGTSNTWWLLPRRSWPYPRLSATWTRRRSCAPESRRTTRCATAARSRATWLLFRASAAWATSGFNSRTSSGTRW